MTDRLKYTDTLEGLCREDFNGAILCGADCAKDDRVTLFFASGESITIVAECIDRESGLCVLGKLVEQDDGEE